MELVSEAAFARRLILMVIGSPEDGSFKNSLLLRMLQFIVASTCACGRNFVQP